MKEHGSHNPFGKPDLFRRITKEPRDYLLENLSQKTPEMVAEIKASAPEFSLMALDEADALLTEKGAVWFISAATDLDHFEASRLFEAGKPWPLCSIEDEKIWSSGPLSPPQVAFLREVFQPVKMIGLVLYDLLQDYWLAENQPGDGPIQQARAYWEHVAKRIGAKVEAVKQVAIALHVYHCCIQNFIRQSNQS